MSDRMVTVASFVNPVEGEVACEYLLSEGFSAEIDNLAMQTSVLGAGNPFASIRLRVPREEAEAALGCLRERDGAPAPVAAPVGSGDLAPVPGFDQPDWNARERLVERAYRCSVIGPFLPVPFVNWYGLLCVIDATGRPEPLRPSHRRKFVASWVISAVSSLLWLGAVAAVAGFFL